jgi:hypothetical protein
LGGLGLGFYFLSAHQFAPGQSATPSPTWVGPEADGPAERPRLVLFIHPYCPCTPAALRNLTRVTAGCQTVIYLAAPDAADCPNGRLAAGVPGADVRPDPDGTAARRFGAMTSGHVFLYAPGGRLVFDGGVTAGRGHEGDCPGMRALTDRLSGTAADPVSLPVFGCSLFQ